ncbi:hypothetical protein ACE1CI_15560 [Aerosakkonemataceae cyanobacterium BLCC-F50]|uniref:Virion structural protein n=1 Tax=Floridaenema flaviceps BLCC-F50 TaxID=3153642 RepID=A0ABV4XRH3_9CYAN
MGVRTVILEELLHDIQKVAPTPPGPIASFEVTGLTVQDIVILASSTSEGYSAGDFTVLSSSSIGDVVGEKDTLTLGQYQYVYVNSNNFKLRIDPNFWLTNLNIKIWKGKPDIPFSSVGANSGNVTLPKNTPVPATTTTAVTTAKNIANARTNRTKLTIYNDSNGTLLVKYGGTVKNESGGWDDKIKPYTIFEFPGPGTPPDTSISGIWIAPSSGTLTGNCTVCECVSSN